MSITRIPYTYISIEPSSAFPHGWDSPIPMVSLSLINGSQRISCLAIVDSGASCCCFPRVFLAQLGIHGVGLPFDTAVGIGGMGVRVFQNVAIELNGFAPFRVYAGFAEHLDSVGKGILGQRGFFDRFKIHFDLQQGAFEIEN